MSLKSDVIRVMFVLLLLPSAVFGQVRPNIKYILDQLGKDASVYFLTANRPSYSVSSYTSGKNKLILESTFSFNDEIFALTFDVNYGISNSLDFFSGIDAYIRAYNFAGEKIQGVGDSRLGIRYKFQESYYFSHAFQTAIKIPTASSSKQLGTGFMDFHFGVGQGFSAGRFDYELSMELNFLRRRKLPDEVKGILPYLPEPIDSIRRIYSRKYEPEFVAAFSPGYFISGSFYGYLGALYTRNFALDYSYELFFTGIDFSPNRKIGFNIGFSSSFPLSSGWILSTGFYYFIL